ncbi:hypothetical protein [Mycobacteroides immunogenum]|uniref:hypothetical protein n=1 Tax=Mycobacteroides immunogenum TaxID=83262 RepID=UPI0010420472|nr:hypothetical protein [Mycobacteroides immunogenum]
MARADREFPNTDDFVSASPEDYRALVGGYANTGIRFGTPDGLHCSMSVSLKGSGGGTASCWGALPGAPPGGANMVYVDSDRGSSFVRVDLAAMERTWVLDPAHPGAGQDGFYQADIDPKSYRLLPAGSSIRYPGGSELHPVCVVDDAGLTACQLRQAGGGQWRSFVVSPQGSWVS